MFFIYPSSRSSFSLYRMLRPPFLLVSRIPLSIRLWISRRAVSWLALKNVAASLAVKGCVRRPAMISSMSCCSRSLRVVPAMSLRNWMRLISEANSCSLSLMAWRSICRNHKIHSVRSPLAACVRARILKYSPL